MYNVEWISKDEQPGPLGGWIKILSYEQIAPFCKETIEAGGIILRITKA